MSDIVEIMARASYYALTKGAAKLRPGAPFKEWEELPEEHRELQRTATRGALSALEEKGYVVVKKTPGITHEQEGFEGEKD